MIPANIDWLGAFNTVTLTAFAILVAAAFLRMGYRTREFILGDIPVPVLLKRDLLLFGTFFLVFGIGGVLSRLLDWPLSRNPLWVVPTSLLALGATLYWVWVEYHLDG